MLNVFVCLGAMGPKTFEILSAPHGLERNPDTVDDFYRLCSRYVQHLGSRFAAFTSSFSFKFNTFTSSFLFQLKTFTFALLPS